MGDRCVSVKGGWLQYGRAGLDQHTSVMEASSETTFPRGSPERLSRSGYSRAVAPATGVLSPVSSTATTAMLLRSSQPDRPGPGQYYQDTQAIHKSRSSPGSLDPPPPVPPPRVAVGVETGSGGSNNNLAGSGDTAYTATSLRAGYIDLRNSYSEKIKPRYTAYPGRPKPAPYIPPQASTHPNPSHALQNQLGGVYRSNSSLDLDKLDARESVHRDYGSTSSLDLIGDGTHTGKDRVFTMLQDYHRDTSRPTHATDRVNWGHSTMATSSNNAMGHDNQGFSLNARISNGSLPVDEELPSGDSITSVTSGSQSPRLKSKSQKSRERKQRSKTTVAESGSGSSGGIFKKLRGVRSEDSSKAEVGENDAASKAEEEERRRRKAFIHYDCQSVGLNHSSSLTSTEHGHTESSPIRRRNTTTGASAASGVRPPVPGYRDDEDPGDPGDGKSNDLLLSCPFFRNEVGGEEEKTICLNRSTAQRRAQQLLMNKNLDTETLIPPALCNGVSVLDTSVSPRGIRESPTITTPRGLLLEYVDQGAQYYRNFFNGQGESQKQLLTMATRAGEVADSVSFQ